MEQNDFNQESINDLISCELPRLPFESNVDEMKNAVDIYITGKPYNSQEYFLDYIENKDIFQYEYNDPTIQFAIVDSFCELLEKEQMNDIPICRTINIYEQTIIHFLLNHLEGRIAYVNFHTAYIRNQDNVIIQTEKSYIVRIDGIVRTITMYFTNSTR